MKVCLKGLKSSNCSTELLMNFIEFMNSQMPLNEDIIIIFSPKRIGEMTSGVRKKNEIIVLSGKRLPLDILRTLSHEWVHEYQHQKMGAENMGEIPDIGGPIENMANSLAGIFMKKFQKEFPNFEKELYKEQVSINKQILSELSPESAGVKELIDLVKDYPEVLTHLKFPNLKTFKEFLSDADYNEFSDVRSDAEYFVDRRKRYLKSEMDEIERVVQDLNRNEKIDISVKTVLDAFDNAREVKIPETVWKKLENTECNKIKKGEMAKVISLAKKYNKQSPKELKTALQSGEYKRPLILKFGDRYHLVAGNTRLCTAAAMGIRPQVLIGEI